MRYASVCDGLGAVHVATGRCNIVTSLAINWGGAIAEVICGSVAEPAASLEWLLERLLE